MGYDNGFSGGWGYVLNDLLPPQLMAKLTAAVEGTFEERIPDTLDALKWEITDFFERIGIIIPSCALVSYEWIGAYAGNRFLPENLFMLTVGVYLPPWHWPSVDESFKRTAELVGYVWGG